MKEIVVLCDGSRVDELITDLNCHFEDDTHGGILWSGTMYRYGLGVIFIECKEDAGALLQALREDADIFDFGEGPEEPMFYVARVPHPLVTDNGHAAELKDRNGSRPT
jgi:hypothetical protein